jgi:uncharacterized protein (DUF362 family)
MAETTVAVVKDADIRRRTEKALKLVGGIERVVGSGDKVLVKPNLVDGAPLVTGEVVQLETIEVLVAEAFRAGAADVVIGESATWRRKTKTVEAYERLAARLGARFLDLNQHPFEEVRVDDPVLFETVRVSKPLLDSDVFLNVPTLKTHCQGGVTIAIKNMYGTIYGLPGKGDKTFYHSLDCVPQAILDLYKARPADLIVVDGTYSTFHIGPRPLDDFHETFRLDLTLAGRDPVAVDTVGARILGIDPKTVRYFTWGEASGLGTGRSDAIEVVGTPIEDAYVRKGVDAAEFANRRMVNMAILNAGACTGCLKLATDLLRFDERVSRDPRLAAARVLVVMGPDADAERVKAAAGDGVTVLCGACAAPTFFNGLDGVPVPGCPPAPEDVQKLVRTLAVTALTRRG